ncbi:MAG: molybdopterin molybdotransferase MoeA [Gemmatimonadota bacterium]|nr:MAG: molybdopterin molybdotransferase MoeA [Gemmatimonadota bacterium]
MRTLLTSTDAARTILESIRPLPSETVPITAALGMVSASDVTSPIDLPHWDNSAMDGYAVRSEDVRGRCPVDLQIVEQIHAGAFPEVPLSGGQCARIFTGAPIPEGSDGVIRQEDTTVLPDGKVQVNDDRDSERNIRFRGEDIRLGTTVLKRGTELQPAHIGALASVARDQIAVYRRPRVAIMASGDEIADLSEKSAILEGRKIASSNSYTMSSMARQAGAEPVELGIVPDDPALLGEKLLGLPPADMLVSSGGVSVGDHDYFRRVFEELGGEMKFWRLRTRPGAPVAFGLWRGVPWLGLPGNPVSTMVTFELFVRPAIRVMLGHSTPFRKTVKARTTEPITLQAPLRHFLRVVLEDHGGELLAKLTGPQGSGILTSMATANALLIVPEDKQELPGGVELSAIRLNEVDHVNDVPY